MLIIYPSGPVSFFVSHLLFFEIHISWIKWVLGQSNDPEKAKPASLVVAHLCLVFSKLVLFALNTDLSFCSCAICPLTSISLSFRYAITKAFVIAFVMTFFSVFDVPVFWPILLCYWVVLFVLTMKRQIVHMIKYKYVPFSIGKQVSTYHKTHSLTSVYSSLNGHALGRQLLWASWELHV